MKTKKKDEIIDEVAKVSMQLHEAEDHERKLCTENGKVFAHQMQTSTSENRSEPTDILTQTQNAESENVKPKIPSKWFERCKRWFGTYPIVIMILFCSIYLLSGTNAKLGEINENKRYSDADTDIITELTTDQLTTKLELHGLEYLSDFYVDCDMNYSRLHFDNGIDYAADYKYKSSKNFLVTVTIVFDINYNFDNIDKYISQPERFDKTDKYSLYETKISTRRQKKYNLYIQTANYNIIISFTDNSAKNLKIYENMVDTIICNIK